MTLADGLVSGADVAAAARDSLRAGLERLLPHLSRPLPLPRSYELVPTSDNVRRVEGTVVAVSVPGLSGDPTEAGIGAWRASWSLVVAVFSQDTAQTPVLTAPADYAAAVRAALLTDRTLGGFATDLDWTGESVDLLGDELTPRTLGLALVEFTVSVDDTTDPRFGPGFPLVPVTTTDVGVTAVPVYEEAP